MGGKIEKADGLTQEIAGFISGTTYEDLSRESVRLAKRCLVDGTGVILAGSTDQASVIIRPRLLPWPMGLAAMLRTSMILNSPLLPSIFMDY